MSRLFLHSPLNPVKKGDYPASPFVYLAVEVPSYSPPADDPILVSSQLASDSEIDAVVNKAIQELEEFRKAAKKELKAIVKAYSNKNS